MIRKFLFLVVLSVFFSMPTRGEIMFYVAPNGNDANSGTSEKPFVSLEGARDAIRQLKKGKGFPAGGITVWLHGGIYTRTKSFELDERDSGEKDSPIVYRSLNHEEAILMGGRMIDPANLAAVSDAEVLKRIIHEEARGKIWQLNLKKMGITNYGMLHTRGFRRPYVNPGLELFINGRPLHLARWPNKEYVLISEVIDTGSIPRGENDLLHDGDYSNRGGIFRYDYERPTYWKNANDIWISGFFCWGYADDTVKIKTIDTEQKTISTVQAAMYGFAGGMPSRKYYVLNLLEEIDEPGEYYLDRDRGILYFYPPADEEICQIAVSELEEPMVTMEGTSYVTFRDLTFEVSRGMGIYIERGTGNLIAGCTLRNLGVIAVCMGKGIEPDPLYHHNFTGTPVSRQLGSWHEHMYENSAYNRDAGTNHGVIGCDMYNLGAGGVSLGGGDRKTLTPAGNYVRNCHFYNFNRLDRSYKAAVNIDGVGNRVEHCEIHDAPGCAVYLFGNNHIIEYNRIYRTCLDADDMGVFYMGRNPSEQGNIIRYNFFHHNGNDLAPTSVVYFDDDSCGTQVLGNVFYKNKAMAGWVNGGCDHVYKNNILIDNKGTVSEGRQKRNYDWKTEPLIKKRLQEDVDITRPPYSTSYPRLLLTYNIPRGEGRGSDLWYNVAVNSGEFTGGTNDLKNNLTIQENPGFVNAEEMNFQLREDSIVYEKISEFEKIPFEKIGLYVDEFRKTVPPAFHP